MSRPFTLKIRTTGSISLGGITGDVSARDGLGRPYIPATALRGALRSTLESLLRGADQPACAGGTGLAVDAAQGERPGVCALGGEGRRCLACQLFGGHQDHVPEDGAFFSALILGDATTESIPAWTTRPAVGVHRRTRSANNHTLAMHHVPSPAGVIIFIAQGRLVDHSPEFERLLRAALAATNHLGAGRSRGLGRVDFALEFHDTARARPVVKSADTDQIRLCLTLVTPASLGVPIADDNLRDTRREIPGAALRGAIGFALAEALHGVHDRQNPDPAFEQLVAEDGARFSFFYPVDPATQPMDPTVLPCTALECKFSGRTHVLVDSLLDAIAATIADTQAAALRVAQTTARATCSHSDCTAPLRSARGPRACAEPIKTRTITRLAMDRARGTAKNEMLFSQVLLEAGTRFAGTIHHIPPAARDRLELALQQPLSIGRGRASGWGRVEVTRLQPLTLPSIARRADEFHRGLRARLLRAGLPPDEATRWIPITLHSPLIPEHGDEDGEAALLRKLPACSIPFKARRFTREGGWDQREHGMQPALAVAAGGVFAVRIPEKTTFADVLQQLDDLERDGLGQRRFQGYGTLRCFDQFHR
jgi:CRISPR-associated Csx10 family RAMP protein